MMAKNSFIEQKKGYRDVAAIVTAMTNDEKPFLFETLKAVFSDPCISQVILCVEEKNNWLDSVIEPFILNPLLNIVRIPMMSIGSVRNKALTYVEKSWVAYCDGDDTWCKDKTFIQRTYADQKGADLVGTGHYLTDESGKVRAYGLSLFIPMPSSWLVRTEIMKQYPFDESLTQGSDGKWWIKTNHIIKKVKCPKILMRYRVRSFSVSTTATSKKRKLRLVNFARTPILGLIILFLTYCIWLFTRHQEYRWISNWAKWLLQFEKKAKKENQVE